MPPGVPGNEGERYQRRPRPRSAGPGGRAPPAADRRERGHWDGLAGRVPGARGQDEGVGSRCDGQPQCIAAGALALLAGCNGLDGGRRRRHGGAARRLGRRRSSRSAPADGAADVSPDARRSRSRSPTASSATSPSPTARGAEGGRRRRAAPPSSPAATVWTPDDAAGLRHELHADGDARRTPPTRRRRPSSTFTTVTPTTLSTPSIGPLDGTTVGVGHADPRLLRPARSPTRPPSRATCRSPAPRPTDGAWNWMSDSEVHFRPSQYWPAEHPRDPRRQPLRRELRRRRLGREGPHGVLRHRRQARLGRRRRQRTRSRSTTATRSCRPTR